MQWTIGKKLYTCIGGLALATVAMIVGGMYTQREIASDLDRLATRTAPALQDAEELTYAVEGVGSALRDGVVAAVQHNKTAIERDMKEIDDLQAEFTKHAAELEAETDVAEAKVLAAECQKIMDEVKAKSNEFAALLREFKADEAANNVGSLEALVLKCQDTANRIADLQVAQLQAVTAASEADERLGMTVQILLGLTVFVTLGIVGYVVRGVIRTLSESVYSLKSGTEQVTAAAAQVAASAQSLSQGSTEQAASLEETSASMEEMASMTRKNAENSEQAAQLMVNVGLVVEGSNTALREMTESMASIRDSSSRVAKIIKTIDEIAFQTNILALNAAVEAARAGEAGMGFAVVADEVRNLAQRSAQAARDTAALIEESIVNSQEGHAKVDVVAKSIAAITDSVGQVKELVNEVSQASRQQSQGVDQVAEAVSQMEQVTQSTAASAEESAAASEELNAQAETTLIEVARLEALVTSNRTAAVPSAPVRHAPTAAELVAPKPRPSLPKARWERRSPLSVGAKFRARTTPETQIPLEDTGTDAKF